MENCEFKAGDRVYYWHDGFKNTGTIARVYTSTRRRMAKYGIPPTTFYKADVVPDSELKGYYTAPIIRLTKLDEEGDARRALEGLIEIKEDFKEAKQAIRNKHYIQAKERNLLSLKDGDAIIIINFRTKYSSLLLPKEATFKGFVPSSFNVRFLCNGRIGTTPPRYVSVKS